MFGEPDGPKDGDRIGDVCDDCGDRYSRVVGGDGDPKYCSDCVGKREQFNDLERVGGTWRVRDDDVRERVISLLEQEYIVDVDERLGDIWCYKPNDD